MSLKLRSILVALVLVNLLASAAFALPRASRPAPAPVAGFSAVWDWMVGLFVPSGPATKAPSVGSVAKEGSSMDPNGHQNFSTISSGSTTLGGGNMGKNGIK
jgi:hypothetical protein